MKEAIEVIFCFFSKLARFHFVIERMTKLILAFLPFLVKTTIIIP
jgi:hypothetical protein